MSSETSWPELIDLRRRADATLDMPSLAAFQELVTDLFVALGVPALTCLDCGHLERFHGLVDTASAGCWTNRCGCRLGRPLPIDSLTKPTLKGA